MIEKLVEYGLGIISPLLIYWGVKYIDSRFKKNKPSKSSITEKPTLIINQNITTINYFNGKQELPKWFFQSNYPL